MDMPLKNFTEGRKDGDGSIVSQGGQVPLFGIGTTLAHFQLWGNVPVLIDKLNRLVRLGSMLDKVPFNILVEMASVPVALLQSRAAMRLETCSSVHRR